MQASVWDDILQCFAKHEPFVLWGLTGAAVSVATVSGGFVAWIMRERIAQLKLAKATQEEAHKVLSQVTSKQAEVTSKQAEFWEQKYKDCQDRLDAVEGRFSSKHLVVASLLAAAFAIALTAVGAFLYYSPKSQSDQKQIANLKKVNEGKEELLRPFRAIFSDEDLQAISRAEIKAVSNVHDNLHAPILIVSDSGLKRIGTSGKNERFCVIVERSTSTRCASR